MSDNIENNIDQENLIYKFGVVEPNYHKDLNKEREFTFGFLPNGKLILIGSMDWQYPYWLSISDVNDTDMNSKILQHILFDEFSSFTNIWEKKNAYKKNIGDISKTVYNRPFYIKEGEITLPHKFKWSGNLADKSTWPRALAESMPKNYATLKGWCMARECKGDYREILNEYLQILQNTVYDDPVKDYEQKEHLIQLLESEDYLLLSDDEEMRKLYIKIDKKSRDLYNAYMTLIR